MEWDTSYLELKTKTVWACKYNVLSDILLSNINLPHICHYYSCVFFLSPELWSTDRALEFQAHKSVLGLNIQNFSLKSTFKGMCGNSKHKNDKILDVFACQYCPCTACNCYYLFSNWALRPIHVMDWHLRNECRQKAFHSEIILKSYALI